MTSLLSTFINRDVGFVKCFFWKHWGDNLLLSFILLTWCITLSGFHRLNPSCTLGINSTRSWCIILFICCWIVCSYFTEDFCIYICKRYWFVVLFSCNICFSYQGNTVLIEWIGLFDFLHRLSSSKSICILGQGQTQSLPNQLLNKCVMNWTDFAAQWALSIYASMKS